MPEAAERREEIRRAVWAALETRRSLTFDDLEELTEMSPREFAPYLNSLIRNEYVSMTGAGRTSRGEWLPRFTLISYAGPQAPTEFQNAAAEAARFKSRDTLMLKELEPSPSAKLIAEALRLGEFSTTEIGDAAGLGEKREYVSQYLRALAVRSWIIRLGKRRWRMAGIPEDAQCVMRALKEAAGGEPVGMDRARRLYGGVIPQRTIGFTVDVLRAQGWVIRQGVQSGNGNRNVYQVDKP